jgi:hypothetical protein
MPTLQKNRRSKSKSAKQAFVPVLFRCKAADINDLDQVAVELGHTRSSLCRFVMSNFVADHKSKQ